METILDKIISKKFEIIDELNEKKAVLTQPIHLNKKRSFIKSLKETNQLSIIAEFKRASPSKGNINMALDPKEQAKKYEEFGANVISVLTDTPFFKGSYKDLLAVRETVDIPILCKDFIIDSIQIDFAKHYGADLILLIVAALEKEKLQTLYDYAISKDLEVLVEVHNEAELKQALQIGAELIGVNNRNLKTFHVDLETTEELGSIVKKHGKFLVSESGIATKEHISKVVDAGANAILVGETFMKATNLEETLKEMKVTI